MSNIYQLVDPTGKLLGVVTLGRTNIPEAMIAGARFELGVAYDPTTKDVHYLTVSEIPAEARPSPDEGYIPTLGEYAEIIAGHSILPERLRRAYRDAQNRADLRRMAHHMEQIAEDDT